MKRCLLIIILAMAFCTMFLMSQATIDAAKNGHGHLINIDAVLGHEGSSNKDVIIITVKKGKGNCNNNTMKDTQIWGRYGKGWFLIKDYNYNQNKNQEFVWDLSTLDKDNEGYFLAENSDQYRYMDGETDLFKIYVKYNKNFLESQNADNKVELYKSFYLGGVKQDVQLTTNKELKGYLPVSNDFPIVVTQYKKVELYIDAKKDPQLYSVKIIGDNDYEQNDIITSGDTGENQQMLEWVPKDCGTFYIDVYDNSSQLVLRRKVYVNSENKQYLQLNDLTVSEENNIVYVRLKVSDTCPTGFKEEDINTSMRFVISEPQVWSKTIKNYGDVIRYDESTETYEINENSEGFTFGSGNYYVNATIKAPNSIEPEDGIGKYYRKLEESGVNTDDFKITFISNEEPNDDGSYSIKDNNLQFTFTVENKQNACEYAFFLSDARGKRMVQEYSDNTIFEFNPSDPGKYRVYARIRKIGENKRLPNSYEKEVSEEIWVAHPERPIVLKNVIIEGNKWNIENGIATKNASEIITNINAHKLNVIEINAECNGCNCDECNCNKSSLMYKVEVVAKGYWYQITPYTAYNRIPFYPRSPGEHRLIVKVKDSSSGSWEDYCKIFINVTDVVTENKIDE